MLPLWDASNATDTRACAAAAADFSASSALSRLTRSTSSSSTSPQRDSPSVAARASSQPVTAAESAGAGNDCRTHSRMSVMESMQALYRTKVRIKSDTPYLWRSAKDRGAVSRPAEATRGRLCA